MICELITAEHSGEARLGLGQHGGIPFIPLSNEPVVKFASVLGISQELVQGACSPSMEAPYLHLDMHCWEDMKKQLPPRGPGSIAPIAVAATLLALWMRTAGTLGSATQAHAQKVLATIELRDPNASRGLSSTPWLQTRPGGVIVVNPAQMSKAITVARSFCIKQWKIEAQISVA